MSDRYIGYLITAEFKLYPCRIDHKTTTMFFGLFGRANSMVVKLETHE